MKTKHLFFTLLSAVVLASGLSSCNDDDDKVQKYEPVAVGDLIIVNEGNYPNKINGSMDFLAYGKNGNIQHNVFKTLTGRELGGTPNNAVACGSLLFIACTDENVVEVFNLNTNNSTQIKVNAPRELATDKHSVYVSSYEGKVTKIDVASLTVVGTSDVIGNYLEGITVVNGFVYVCNAYNKTADPETGYDIYDYKTNVVKLNSSDLTKVKDITVAANPNIILTDGNNVYVDSWGNYFDVQPTVQRINASDNVTPLTSATWMAYCKNKLYLIEQAYDENRQSTFKYKTYDLTSNTESIFLNDIDKTIFYPGTIGVDPLSDEIFITSYIAGDYGYADYSANGYLMRYKNDGSFIKKYETGVGPCTLVFLAHYELKEKQEEN